MPCQSTPTNSNLSWSLNHRSLELSRKPSKVRALPSPRRHQCLTTSGITAVAQVAAPVALNFTDPEPILKGAIDGTLRILKSAHGEPIIKSVLIMSSAAVVVTPERAGKYTYTESDWNA